MRYVGIDLAWGEQKPTGLAVLDVAGRLLHLSAVRTDEEIEAELAVYVDGPCLVGIDAPVVVRNATGSRPCEKQLSADFRAFDAGTHPSNTGKPEFAGGRTRAARIAKRLGLDIDPRSGRDRRAIEVYPHSATVVLFGLPRILRYKAKPGRDLELLRSELLTLMDCLESMVTTTEGWVELRAAVRGAGQKSQLRRAEDQVDAVVCALVALFADTRPGDVTTYGDLATGYILTPTLGIDPPGSRPDGTAGAVRAYAEGHAELLAAGRQAVTSVASVLDDAGVNYLSVTGRTKTVASFAEKAARTRGGVSLYDDPLAEITDQLGVRVITYVRDDVDTVADLIADQVVVHDDRDMGQETASEGRFGYASRHLLIELAGHQVQVQVRTVLQHAWAEFEHDIRYKGVVPAEHAREFDRRFTLAAGLLELADREFAEIQYRLRGVAPELPPSGDDDPRLDPRELGAFLAAQYSDAAWSRADHYGWISGLLLELGITSFDELAEVLRRADEPAITAAMDYRHPPGAVRRLDDALLWVLEERYLDLHGNAHRRDGLAVRLERLRVVRR